MPCSQQVLYSIQRKVWCVRKRYGCWAHILAQGLILKTSFCSVLTCGSATAFSWAATELPIKFNWHSPHQSFPSPYSSGTSPCIADVCRADTSASLLEVGVKFLLDVIKAVCSHVVSLALLPSLFPFFWRHGRWWWRWGWQGCRGKRQVGHCLCYLFLKREEDASKLRLLSLVKRDIKQAQELRRSMRCSHAKQQASFAKWRRCKQTNRKKNREHIQVNEQQTGS